MPFDAAELPPVAKQLLQAKLYIEEHGWCQNALHLDGGRVCVLGAIRRVGGHCARNYFASVIRGDYCLEGWNDAPTRRKKHVLAAFDRAIAKAIKDGV